MKRKIYNIIIFTIVFFLAAYITLLLETIEITQENLEEPIRVRSLYPFELGKKKLCYIHNLPLIQDNVAILYGLVVADPSDKYFPVANMFVTGGCVLTEEGNKDTLYCPICRQQALAYQQLGFLPFSEINNQNHYKNLVDDNKRKNNIESIESRDIGKYKVIIKYKLFDSSKYKLKFYDKEQKTLIKVNNKKYYGTDGSIPNTEISSISFFKLDQEYKFPLAQYNLLFNPHLGNKFYSSIFFIKENPLSIEIGLSGGDGAGSYEVSWIIFKNNKVIKRKVSDILVLNEIKRPEITFSDLEKMDKK